MTCRGFSRRDFLLASGAAIVLPGCGRSDFSPDMISEVPSDLRFDVFRAPGRHALSAWETLTQRYAGRASVAVLGPKDSLEYLSDPGLVEFLDPPESIVAKADAVDFPSGFRQQKREQLAEAHDAFRDDPRYQALVGDSSEVGLAESIPAGDWPDGALGLPAQHGPTVAMSWETGAPHDDVYLGVFPTADWTEIPAHAPFGGWNECPLPEWHIAAFRYWRDKWGARLIGLGPDTLDLRVEVRPETRETALELAREQYDYCADIVDQGVGEIAMLARMLMETEWWYFWWD